MNYYTEIVADDTLKAIPEDFETLLHLLEISNDIDLHGMKVEYYAGEVHMFSDENGTLEVLTDDVLDHIGHMITKAQVEHWEFGISYTASRQTPGSRGGRYARIMPDGSLIFSEITWPSDL